MFEYKKKTVSSRSDCSSNPLMYSEIVPIQNKVLCILWYATFKSIITFQCIFCSIFVKAVCFLTTTFNACPTSLGSMRGIF